MKEWRNGGMKEGRKEGNEREEGNEGEEGKEGKEGRKEGR